MLYSHRSSAKRSSGLPLRKLTRVPSGDTAGFISVGPDSGAPPVMASRVSFSAAMAGAAKVMAATSRRVFMVRAAQGLAPNRLRRISSVISAGRLNDFSTA
jgi:hypothetical protein